MLDLLKGYHLIEDEESSREKTALTSHVGPFQYIHLPFGLTNAPASFQPLLEHVHRTCIDKFVILYIDAILILVAPLKIISGRHTSSYELTNTSLL